MNEVVNLRRIRKLKKREAADSDAAAKRSLHGQTKSQKKLKQAERKVADKNLDGHKRTPNDSRKGS
jgi:Domain of unknown function (DUF4169)